MNELQAVRTLVGAFTAIRVRQRYSGASLGRFCFTFHSLCVLHLD